MNTTLDILHTKHYGQGFPVCIIHGLFGSSQNWHSIAQQLQQTMSVITIDLPNHGNSPPIDHMDFGIMAEMVWHTLDHLNIGKCNLMGHSLGAKVALHMIKTRASQVHKLVLADMANRYYEPSYIPIFEALLNLDLSLFNKREEISKALSCAIPDTSVRTFLLKNITRRQDKTFYWKCNLVSLAENYYHLGDPIEYTQPISNPTLLIYGGQSSYVGADDIQNMKLDFSHLDILRLDNAGHWIQVDEKEIFLQQVESFFIPLD